MSQNNSRAALALGWTTSLVLAFGLACLSQAGCGSVPMPVGQRPNPPGNSAVTLLLTSTANDELTDFRINLASVELIGTNGNSVELYSSTNSNLGPEFMHLNGAVEPLATATVPQGTYTSATVTTFGCSFTTLGVSTTGGIEISTYAQGLCGQGTGTTTVNLPGPIVVDGASVVLALDLEVSQSYTLTTRGAPGVYTISPVFALTRNPLAAQPANEQDGKILGLSAQVSSIDPTNNTIDIETSDGTTFSVRTNASTVYQGVSGFSSVPTGVVANFDIAIQPDGTFQATRVEVDDPNEPALLIGPWLESVNGGQPDNWLMQPVEMLNCRLTAPPVCGGVLHNTNSTAFGVSQEFSNIASLPFTATFNRSTNFAGQNVGAFVGLDFNSNTGEAVSTVALEPQTINGTVLSTSTQNGFSVYTVRLAPYDPIVTLESISPAPPLNNPPSVIVYVDSNTQLLNSLPVESGTVARFRGIIFSDNGTARMDCSAILDGVAE